MSIKSKVLELGLIAGLLSMGADMGSMPVRTRPIVRGSVLPRKVYKARKRKLKQQSRSRMINLLNHS